MWYAVQVSTGDEENTIRMCETIIGQKYLEDLFCPEIEVQRHFKGEWHKIRRPLFPGYVIAVTEQIEALYEIFYSVPKLTKILGTDKTPVSLTEEEIAFIRSFTNEEHVIEMSEGILVGDKLIIRSGPLKGKEGLVRFIDRHKRIARLEVEMFANLKVEVEIGLEVTEKIPAEGAKEEKESMTRM